VQTLFEDGSKHAVSAGETIARAVANKVRIVGLTPKEESALLRVLDNPRSEVLLGLRDAVRGERERETRENRGPPRPGSKRG
jgi:hypothetical protein